MNKWKHKLKKLISMALATLLIFSLFPAIPAYAAGGTFSGGGTSANPYLIEDAADLAQLATYVNAGTAPYANAGVYYKLANDISLSAYNWMPIGTSITYSFKGDFNGSGYILSGLSMSGAKTTNYLGLFGYAAEGSVIRNLGMTNVNINTTHTSEAPYIGGLVGYNKGTIINCYTTGSLVKGAYTGGSIHAGGLVGQNNGGSITNGYSVITSVTGNADGNGANLVGGLAGSHYTNGTITNCYASSNTLTSGGAGGNRVPGGLVGNSNATVTNCFWNSSATHYSGGTAQTKYGLGVNNSNTGTTGMTSASMQIVDFATTLNSGKASITGAATWVFSSGYPSFSAFTLTYNANGGSLDNIPSTQKNYAGAINNVIAQTLTRQGHYFHGWATDSGATTAEYQPGEAYTGNADVTLYAVWESVDAPIGSPTIPAIRETSADDGSFSDTQTITLANGTFDAGITKSDVIIGNLPDGLDYTVTRLDETSIEITFTMNAAEHTRSFSASDVTVSIEAGRIIGLDGIPTTTNITCGSFALVFIEIGLDYDILEGGNIDGEHSDIDVQAKITGEGGSVYKIDIAWGAMTFEYSTSGVWNPDIHSYDEGTTVGWLPEGFVFGNNKITAWNHSNGDVEVSFSVVPEIIGVAMTVHQNNSPDSADAVGIPLDKVPYELSEAQSISAYLWLDGEPEDLESLAKETYTKSAVITATISATGGELTPKQ